MAGLASKQIANDRRRQALALVLFHYCAPGQKTASSPAGVDRLGGWKPGRMICVNTRSIAAIHLRCPDSRDGS